MGEEVKKLETSFVASEMVVSFSTCWVEEIGKICRKEPDAVWQLVCQGGKRIRASISPTAISFSEIPQEQEFPLSVEHVPETTVMEEELERLQLEQELLEELLIQQQLEVQNEQLEQKAKSLSDLASHLNSTIPASSSAAPSNCSLAPCQFSLIAQAHILSQL